jgi:hypothetical protein
MIRNDFKELRMDIKDLPVSHVLPPSELHTIRRIENAGACAWAAVSAWDQIHPPCVDPDGRAVPRPAMEEVDLGECVERARMIVVLFLAAFNLRHRFAP